ncbi:cell number regulator 4-like [Gambusia affinis]|uniref:cell number regulator 4-like n=1 Tax=Gambusia affinis TaxID=33528 RepID=UPI000F30EC23|nr:cell number regulator 4-like [Gambusia affinis]
MTETPLKQWKSGLFDCFEDVNTCCYGFWCCPFLACTVSRRFGEHTCLPLIDGLVSATVLVFGTPVMIPPVALSLRASIRNKRGLKGSLSNDICSSCCCVWCSWCQMHRELKEETPLTVVAQQPQTLQPPTVINVQANPVMMVNQNSAPLPAGFQNPAQGPIGFQNPPPYPGGFQNLPPYPGGFHGFQNLPPNPGGF